MIWIGTSGYNYPEWKGSFYPEKLPSAKMLPYYAERFPTVEINYTFYRSPNEKILDGWNKATPAHFKLTLKAPRRITHDRRLRDCADLVRQFLETAATLGPKLGALLFQLPPNLKKDKALLGAFLDAFPPRVCAAFEFRHESWLDEEIYDCLRARNLALCVADSERLSTPVVVTAELRLLPSPRRGLHAGRHRTLGRRDTREDVSVSGGLCLFQARRGREGTGVCEAAGAASRRRAR
jgi:uncharacterized protein YecE (DUF72 family)